MLNSIQQQNAILENEEANQLEDTVDLGKEMQTEVNDTDMLEGT